MAKRKLNKKEKTENKEEEAVKKSKVSGAENSDKLSHVSNLLGLEEEKVIALEHHTSKLHDMSSSEDEDDDASEEGNGDAAPRKQKSMLLDALDSKEGVIYLGHIPHGFYEDQMKGFFTQFGNVKRLRLSRSKKTGKSRGYAFIQFDSNEVAKIVRDAMDKYILCGKLLVCEMVSPENVHERMFVGSRSEYRIVNWYKNIAEKHNRTRSKEEQKLRNERAVNRQKEQLEKLKAKGIEYEFKYGYGKKKSIK